jgi:hypothetical protein
MSRDIKFKLTAQDRTGSAVKSAKNGIMGIAGGFVIAQAAIEAFKKAYDVSVGFAIASAKTYARTETLGVALERIGKNANISSEALRESETALKKLGITTQGSRSIMANLITAQIDLSQATGLARTAQDFAVLSGENSTEVTMALTDAITSNNTQMLKKYGIIATTEKVLDDYADSVGKAADELTAAEKQQAFLNLVLEKGEAVSGLYSDAMETAGKKMGSMSRLTEELRNEIGEGLQPILIAAVDAGSDALKKLQGWFAENKDEVTRFSKKVVEFAGKVASDLLPLGESMIDWLMNAATWIEENETAVKNLMVMVLGLVTTIQALKTALAIQAAVQGAIAAFGALQVAVGVASAGIGAAGAVGGLAAAIALLPLAITIGVSMVGFALIIDQIIQLKKSADDLSGTIERTHDATGDLITRMKEARAAGDHVRADRLRETIKAGQEGGHATNQGMFQPRVQGRAQGMFQPRALGGPVSAGLSYMVGEHGKEKFVPSVSGSIVPNHELGGGGGLSIGSVTISTPMDFDFFKRELAMAVS